MIERKMQNMKLAQPKQGTRNDMQLHKRLVHENSQCSVSKQVERGKESEVLHEVDSQANGKCVKVDIEGKANNKGEDKDDNFERGSSYTYRKEDIKARSSQL